MDASGALHPTDRTLRAYGLGKLGVSSAEAVNKHLESCAACRRRVAEITSDTFLGRLRDAQDRPELYVPVVSATSGLSMLDAGVGSTPAATAGSLAAGLADHPDYEILRELAHGGMGTVYLAQNRLMGRLEVLKVVSSHLLNRRGVLDRFLAEIRNAARLHHPNVVTAYSALRMGDNLVLAMEYVEGLDLARIVKAKGPLPLTHACNYVHQAALALQHAHDHGMVHRDIKPSNLMLCRQGNRAVIKVLDFGLAKVSRESPIDGGLTQEGQMLGSPDYIAPEQISDARQADIRADVYSLGCTCYYLISGSPPFAGTSLYDILRAHHSDYAPALNLAHPEVPVELAALVAKMMAKEPERRFQEPKDVAQAIAPFFKSTALGPGRSSVDLSGLHPPVSTPIAAPSPAVPPSATTNVPRASGKPVATARPGSPREIPTELLDLQHDSDVVVPTLASQPSWRGPRRRLAIITAGVLGILIVCMPIYLATRKPAHITDGGPAERKVDGSKVPASIAETFAVLQKSSAGRANSGARYGLHFDPDRKSFVKIRNFTYDGSHPITLEAYLRPLSPPDQAKQYAGTIISDAGAAGMRTIIELDGHAGAWAQSTGLWHGIKSRGSVIGKRTHLAEVLADRHLSFFVNGKQAGSFDLPGPFEGSPLPFYIGANSMIDGSPTQVLSGIIEQVRISSTARYRDDFEPAEWLECDASTLLQFQLDRDTDDFAIDSSGHGNHGLILGADLVLLIDAPLEYRSPVADGKIGAGEYGPPLEVDYATARNPGRLIVLETDGRKWSETVPPQDLSFALYAAHTTRSLFLAFRVTDDFIDDEPEPDDRVFFNDDVELFIDGDRVPNDFDTAQGPAKGASREGFQLVADPRGRQLTRSSDFSNKDWSVATSRLSDGYIVEFEIPLRLIDTADGTPFIPAHTGSFLWFNAAVTDNDSRVHTQEDYGPLWLVGPAGIGGQSPSTLGEKGWRVGLSLSGPRAAELSAQSDGGPPRKILQFNGGAVPVTSLALTREGRTLIAGQNGFVRSWDLATGRERFRVRTDRIVPAVDVTPDGRTVVSAEYRDWNEATRTAFAVVAVRDGTTGAVRHEMKGGTQGLHGVAVSPDGKFLVSTCWSEFAIRVWDAEAGRQVGAFQGHTRVPTVAVFRADGEVLASTGFDTTVRLWNVASRQMVNVFEGHQKEAYALAFSADGKRLASGSYDHTARVWDAVTGKPLAILEHDRPVLCLAFSPDGKTLATGSARFADVNYKYAPALVRVWDLNEKRPRLTLPEFPTQVADLVFTPDGKTLITADREGAIILWDVTSAWDASSR